MAKEVDWKAIHQDPKLKRFFNALKNPSLQIDESLIDEMRTYFIATKDGQLHPKGHSFPSGMKGKQDLIDITELFSRLQSYRERIAHMKVGLHLVKAELDDLYEAAERYLQRNYEEEFATLKTIEQRDKMRKSVLLPIDKVYSVHRKVLEVARLVDENLKNNHFTIVQVQELALNTIDRRDV